ncbi:MAG: 50S ribosomal protein L11 methyltransferase [Zoogloeaceae bacterium]|jgi:ribosomal protein L11 methyltransferase|nr:50S ribosomal protein L11 methyltransferase [Zoogloeaceae bacterium]
MAWVNLSLLTDAAQAEPLGDALLAGGALSVSIEDADAGTPAETPCFGEPGMESAEPSVWARSRVIALFEENAPVTRILAEAGKMLTPPRMLEFELARLEEEDWVRQTQRQFAPIQISPRLWIVPSWHESPDPAAINLLLDPGMAFGTGSHPTTRLCLEWLEHTLVPGQSLLDYGTGSGILAIAAARLGAGEVAGVDIDPLALRAARANAEKNGVRIRFEDSATALVGEYDLVVANILANPLRVLAAGLCAHVRPGGKLALSGILEAQAAELIAAYAPWIPLAVRDCREAWVCLSGTRPYPPCPSS